MAMKRFTTISNDFQTAEHVLAKTELQGLAPETREVLQDMVESLGFERRDVAAKKEDKQHVLHGQLLVLGDARNGKTSLVKAMTGEEFKANENKTKGIEFKYVNRKWETFGQNNMKFGDFDRFSENVYSEKAFWPRIFDQGRYRFRNGVVFGQQLFFDDYIVRLLNLCGLEDLTFILFLRVVLHVLIIPIILGFFIGDSWTRWLIHGTGYLECFYYLTTMDNPPFVMTLLILYFSILGTNLSLWTFGCSEDPIPARFSRSFLSIYCFFGGQGCPIYIQNPIIFIWLTLFSSIVCGGLIHLVDSTFMDCTYTWPIQLDFLLDFQAEIYLPLVTSVKYFIFFAPIGLSCSRLSIAFPLDCTAIFILHLTLLYQQNIHRKWYTITTLALELAIIYPLCIKGLDSVVHIVLMNILLLFVGSSLHIYGRWLEVKGDFKGKTFSQIFFHKDFIIYSIEIRKALLNVQKLKNALDQAFCKLKIKIFDFAGDEEYYAYHQIFLNSNALYVIVFNIQEYIQDNSKDIESKAKRLRFWLESIHSHVPQGTPIFLVGTHRADTGIDTLRQINTYIYNTVGHTFIDEIISNKKDHLMFFPVENSKGADDKGIVSLRENITSVAEEFEDVIGQEIPLSWIKVQDAIMQHNENPQGPVCLTVEDFKEHFKHLYIEWDDKMLKYFHNKGFIIYKDNDKDEVKDKDKNEDKGKEEVKDSEDKEEVKDAEDKHQVKDQVKHKDEVKDGPSKWVLLNPDLLVQIVILLINPPEELTEQRGFIRHWIILRKSGMITTDLLQFIISRVIGEQENEDSSNLLVTFLEEYDLICPLYKDPLRNMQKVPSIKEMTHFVPSLLRPTPSSQPVWNESKEDIKFYIFFDSFLPDALFYRLLSRACKVSYDEIKRSYEPSESIYRDCGVFCLSQQLYCLRLQKKEGRIEVTLSKPKSLWVPNYILTLIGSIVASICKREFQNLSFHCGPECSSPICPGSQSDSTSLLTGQPRRHVHNVYPACQQGGICFLDLFKCQNAYREEDAKMWRPR